MASSALSEHRDFAATYALLEELATAGGDYGILRPARRCLSEAFTELTDSGLHTPNVIVSPPSVANAEDGFDRLEDLLARMLGDVTGLPAVLRLTRVRELVAKARGSG
ncbi:hypothetical protein BSP109_02845 [Brevibacterium sp. Mu109]|nr:hypothetical protein BSP109_02845 [Brevibacterium sp. Mu109]